MIRAAIATSPAGFNDANVVDAFLAGTRADVGNVIVLPAWTSGTRYLALATPPREKITDIRPVTGPINLISAFSHRPGVVTIDGKRYRVFLYDDQLLASQSESEWSFWSPQRQGAFNNG